MKNGMNISSRTPSLSRTGDRHAEEVEGLFAPLRNRYLCTFEQVLAQDLR